MEFFVKMRVVSEKLTKGRYQTIIETVRGERAESVSIRRERFFQKRGLRSPKDHMEAKRE